MEPQFAWMDGQIVDYKQTYIPPLSHSVGYATSVYEGIRSYAGRIFKLDEHLTRLRRSACVFGHSFPYDDEQLRDACYDVLAKAELHDAYIKIQIFFDDKDLSFAARGCNSRILIVAFAKPTLKNDTPWQLEVADWRRPPEHCHPYQAKTSATYALSYLAFADKAPWADDVLFIDVDEQVTEASGANIFFVTGKQLITPPAIRALDGITRQTIIEQAAEIAGFEVCERAVGVDEIGQFDGAFLCGTAVEVKPIGRIGEYHFNSTDAAQKVLRALMDIIAR